MVRQPSICLTRILRLETVRNGFSERGPKPVFVKRGTFLSDIVLFFAKQMKSYFSNITYKGVNSKNYVPNPLVMCVCIRLFC